ncbi:MAG: NAD-dependent dihydropyrimidine dehydrogenase subunit PreA [Planctomycetota bacterium]
MHLTNISINFLDRRLDNPFILASGPATRNAEMIMRGFEAGWAGAVTKTISLLPTKNPTPRLVLYPTPAAAGWRSANTKHKDKWSSFNIELISTDPPYRWVKWIKEIKLNHPDKLLIASIMGSTKTSDWQKLAKQMAEAGADMLELNISCPHGMPERAMGEFIGQDPRLSGQITAAVKKISPVPVMVKLTPNVTDIGLISRACAEAGADALSGINTVKSIAGVDIENLRPIPDVSGNSAIGGYGGAAIKPIALRCVLEMARSGRIPVSGGGGIFTSEDAIEFLLMGASTVQICSAVMSKGFNIISGLKHGLSNYLKRKGFDNVNRIIGLANPYIIKHSKLKFSHKSVAINYKKCIVHCKYCLVACRDAGFQAITLENGKPSISKIRCDGCGLCVYVCPHEAIRIK